MKTIVAGLAFWLASVSPILADKPSDSGKPNVLIILADDLRNDLGCYGSDFVVSPNLDRLAANGLVFDRAYCQKAVCWPSRNSFFSSLMPASLGKTNAQDTFRESHPNIVSLPQWFKQHGWVTRGFGKILHDGQTDSQSWTDPQFFPEPLHYAAAENRGKHPIINRAVPENRINPLFESADVDDEAYEDGLTAAAARKTIRELAKSGESFFLMVGFHKPHTPFNAPSSYWNLYDRSSIPLSPIPNAPRNAPLEYAITDWKYVRSFQDIPQNGPMPDDLAREVRHAYYACVSYVDALVGSLIEELDSAGAGDDTIVLFWSDHGYQLGDHSMWSKHTNFELATRVPLIISVPESKANGCRTAALVELVDIYPTLADLCGLSRPDHVHGRSFANLFDDPAADGRSAAFSEFTRGGARGVSIRTADYRYTEWRSTKNGDLLARELYDHRVDPLEDQNLAEHDEVDGVAKRLASTLQQRLAESAN